MYQEFVIIFGIMLIGYFCGKKGILDEKSSAGLCSLTIYILLPALLFYSTASLELSQKEFRNFFLMVGLSGLVLIATMIVAYIYFKYRRYPEPYRGISEFAAFTNNNGFIGFPLALAIFGQTGLLYMVATNVILGFAIWTYGVHLMQRGKEKAKNKRFFLKALWELLINPNILATIAGLIVCVNQIPLPEVVVRITSSLGSAVTPLAMLYIGAVLAGRSLRGLAKNKEAIEASLFRLILSPLVTVVVVYFLPIDLLMKQILALEMILPFGASIPMVISGLGSDGKYASEVVFVSTLLSIVTMPLWLTWMIKFF